MLRPALPALTGLLFATFAQAQMPAGTTRLAAGADPVYAHLDLDTGEVTMLASPPKGSLSAAAGLACFANNIDENDNVPPGFPSGPLADALLYPAGNELFDWGIKACQGSDFVERIEIGYASMAVPTSQGGPGASLILRVYENAFGFGFPGTEVASISLTGLPSEGPIAPGGLLIPFYVTVDLGAQSFFLPDGPIGWSYENPDDNTAPLLVDVTIPLGTQNYFDVYNPGPASAASYDGTFTLGPGGASNDPFENSFYIVLTENDDAAVVTTIPAGTNPNALSATAPILGDNWRATVNKNIVPTTTSTLLAVTLQSLPPTPTGIGTLVVQPSSKLVPVMAQTGASYDFAIPADPSLLGLTYYAQGAASSLTQGIVLTNGLELTIGTL